MTQKKYEKDIKEEECGTATRIKEARLRVARQ